MTNQIIVTATDPESAKFIHDHPEMFKTGKLFVAIKNGHKFSVGEKRTLIGLVQYPQFNGQEVEIEAIRESGEHGKAYYVKGAINEFINWVYEYRLK